MDLSEPHLQAKEKMAVLHTELVELKQNKADKDTEVEELNKKVSEVRTIFIASFLIRINKFTYVCVSQICLCIVFYISCSTLLPPPNLN